MNPEEDVLEIIEEEDVTAEADPFVEEPIVIDPKKGFRFQGNRVLLTYATHIPKAHMEDHLRSLKQPHITWIRMAHEGKDTKTDYDHTHVLVVYSKRANITNARHWDYPGQLQAVTISAEDVLQATNNDMHIADLIPAKGEREWIHPNVQPIKSQEHFENARYYLGKEDPENADLRAMGKYNADREPEETLPIEAIQTSRNLNEALKTHARKYADVLGIQTIWKQRVVLMAAEQPIIPWKWQMHLYQEMEQHRNIFARTLKWIYDAEGRKGKSIFVRWIKSNWPENYMSIPGVPRENDVAHAIRSHVERYPGKLRGIIFDFPRDVCTQNVYGMLENILNGDMFSPKYDSVNITFPKIHVVCFANWLPSMGTTSMSNDRWDIRGLVYVAGEGAEREVEMQEIPRGLAREMLRDQRAKLREQAIEENVKGGQRPMQSFQKKPFQGPPRSAPPVQGEPEAKRAPVPAPPPIRMMESEAPRAPPTASTAAQSTKIDPRTGQPYKQRSEAEWEQWRRDKAAREAAAK